MIKITPDLLARLKEAGIECFLKPGGMLPDSMVLQPPCSLKWMSAQVHLSMGAFSYAVSGYYFNVTIGRYTSIGENVQVGRGDHPTTWVSTSPAFYLKERLFEIGNAFDGAGDYHDFRPTVPEGVQATVLKRTVIGNDVYIGHGDLHSPGRDHR
jgi:acetyltransferase-like isoleucine patch superfamily enzyme